MGFVFQIFQIIFTEEATKEALLPALFAAVFIVQYLFISNSLGQNITDHNNYVFATV